ncbi:hypothetical protein BJY16_007863 [Actinoplanes octamycinicus]|uniref:Uncharacterized protein n=1 Tax=Actinoplanes octamycinicus TaxID=135948 RepID=A0A7W7H5W3_9ACTN|nr:hypothetical protein [Actinoplanes octamycinicus]
MGGRGTGQEPGAGTMRFYAKVKTFGLSAST